jgi:hypothetical protein
MRRPKAQPQLSQSSMHPLWREHRSLVIWKLVGACMHAETNRPSKWAMGTESEQEPRASEWASATLPYKKLGGAPVSMKFQ